MNIALHEMSKLERFDHQNLRRRRKTELGVRDGLLGVVRVGGGKQKITV